MSQQHSLKRFSSVLMLVLAAFLWGTTFVAQVQGADKVGPFTYVCTRCVLSVICLLPAAVISNLRKTNGSPERKLNRALFGGKQPRDVIISGILCGIVLCTAMSLQQSGMGSSTAGKAAFLTAIYMLIVPVLNLVLFRKKTGIKTVILMFVAVIGLYLLCVKSGESIALSPADTAILACSVMFALHIVIIDHFSDRVNGIMLSCIQFITVAIIAGVLMFVFETPTWEGIRSGFFSIAYAGILSGAVAYTLQILGQKDCDPTVASMAMSLESVFSALSGAIVLGERMTGREYIGCAVIFAAIVVSQLNIGEKKRSE